MSIFMDYEIEETADGSPTLKKRSNHADSETMHNRAGAYTETQHIYGRALREYQALRGSLTPNLHVVSIGLGLGYNEVLATCETLQNPTQSLSILSYESEESLKKEFLLWLEGRDSQLTAVYDQMLGFFQKDYPAVTSQVRPFLLSLYRDQKFVLAGRLDGNHIQDSAAHVIMYDAFSSKTSPELWNENFLKDFLRRSSSETCVLSTYACTGNLKRALRDSGFSYEMRSGFAGKRNSIFAYRLTSGRT